mgnify:CR=1 FL=1
MPSKSKRILALILLLGILMLGGCTSKENTEQSVDVSTQTENTKSKDEDIKVSKEDNSASNIPEEEIKINPNIEYYDVNQSTLNPFTGDDYNKVNKMLKKIAKSHKGSTITVRSFYISQKGTYAMTVTKLDEKGKITSYANEKLRNTVHFPETNYTSYRYTSDIIW